jgi:hypothetical protein
LDFFKFPFGSVPHPLRAGTTTPEPAPVCAISAGRGFRLQKSISVTRTQIRGERVAAVVTMYSINPARLLVNEQLRAAMKMEELASIYSDVAWLVDG